MFVPIVKSNTTFNRICQNEDANVDRNEKY